MSINHLQFFFFWTFLTSYDHLYPTQSSNRKILQTWEGIKLAWRGSVKGKYSSREKITQTTGLFSSLTILHRLLFLYSRVRIHRCVLYCCSIVWQTVNRSIVWQNLIMHHVDHSGGLLIDLLQGLLKFEPSERLTAKEALKHPFFKESNRRL